MSKVEENRRRWEVCQANAAKAAQACYRELQDVRETMAESYAFLIDLESRPRDAFGVPVPHTKKWH